MITVLRHCLSLARAPYDRFNCVDLKTVLDMTEYYISFHFHCFFRLLCTYDFCTDCHGKHVYSRQQHTYNWQYLCGKLINSYNRPSALKLALAQVNS